MFSAVIEIHLPAFALSLKIPGPAFIKPDQLEPRD